MSGNQNNKNINAWTGNKNTVNAWTKPINNSNSQKVAAPPKDGPPVDAMRNVNLSGRNNSSATPQAPAPAATRQAATPQTATTHTSPPQAAPIQANTSQATSSQATSSQATSSQAASSQTGPPDKLPLELHPDGQPKINPEDKKGKDLSYHDEQYATTTEIGGAGVSVKLRTNRFPITFQKLPTTFFVFSVTLPKINDRPVTKRHIKKILMEGVLGSQQPWAQDFAANKIFTDWDGLFVTKGAVAGLKGPAAFQTTVAKFPFHNQSDSPNTTPPTVTATITCLGAINTASLRDYLNMAQTSTPTFNHQVWMRVFNMMVKHFAAQANNTILIGSNKLFNRMPPTAQLLHSGLQARQGFFSSVRPANGFLQLHVNTVASAFFPPGKLIDFLGQYFDNSFSLNTGNAQIRSEIAATIRGLKVRYMYTPRDSAANTPSPLMADPSQGPVPGRVKTCNSLSQINESARTVTFDFHGVEVTVEDHYNNHVMSNYTIQHPHLPLVNVGPKSTRDNPDQEVWIPMELLWIEPDQSLRTTVPKDDMSTMGKYSRRRPLENAAILEQECLQIVQNGRLAINNVIDVTPRLFQTDGRVLPIPPLQYGNKGSADQGRLRSGKWDLVGQQFHTGSDLSKLLVIIVNGADFVQFNRQLPRDQQVQQQRRQQQAILDNFAAKLSDHGVICESSAQVQRVQSVNRNALRAAYANFYQPPPKPNTEAGSNKIRTVLVILPTDNANDYAEVKTWGELIEGVNTVCVTRRKASESLHRAEFQANLALKFNAKLGGKNHVLGGNFQTLLHYEHGTMVVGADVTHPGPASIEHCPSIAAVVASEDKDCVRFPGSMRLRAGRTETILDMKDMMVERLRHWKSKNGGELPDSILYYRDGVSESQFAMVKQQELNAIKAAYAVVGGQDAEVQITVVVCTKRHQTRFYPRTIEKELSQAEKRHLDRNMNFKTGLVVDAPPVRIPYYFDFYLQGHAAIQGTARPCHYFVIDNGMNFRPDDLQQITYNLSWVYATSLTPISLAAPAYYADKMCERGRAWLRPLLVRGHWLRPTPQQVAAIIASLGRHATDQQKKDRIAQHYANGQNAGQVRFWPNNGTVKNPCHPKIEDTMFYV